MRRIYSVSNLRDRELNLISNFKKWLSENDLEAPAWALDEHNEALRYITTHKDNHQATYDNLWDHETWLSETVPQTLAK